jgi:pyrroline-5-carboxylate reductase
MTPASEDRALLIVGGGRMGEALLAGLLEAGRLPSELLVAETSPSRRAELAAAHPGVEVLETPARLASAVLAVKPGDAADAAVAIADAGAERVLSIAAGVTTQAIERAVSGRLRVVRAMPNMPAVIGAGAAAVTPGATAHEGDLAWAEEILGAVGTVVRVAEEGMDAVTGLAGSGPAYVFLVAEAMAGAGVLGGLPRGVAETRPSRHCSGPPGCSCTAVPPPPGYGLRSPPPAARPLPGYANSSAVVSERHSWMP